MISLEKIPNSLLFPITSLLILGCLAAQTFVLVVPIMFYYWPFTDYPMYSIAHYEGEIVKDQYTLVGIDSKGNETEISAEDLGLSFFQFNDTFVPHFLKDQNDPKVKKSIQHLQSTQKDSFVALRVERHPMTLSRDGYVKAPVQVLSVVTLESKVDDE